MTRPQLEHIIRAAGSITGCDELVIAGSQAILGQFPDAPPPLNASVEADVLSLRDSADADLIDGSIGEESPFHRTFGYHAHGIQRETVILPDGWQDRLVRVSTPATVGVIGLCLEAHDLAVSKLMAGREKDIRFVSALVHHRYVDPAVIRQRMALTSAQREIDNRARQLLANIEAGRL